VVIQDLLAYKKSFSLLDRKFLVRNYLRKEEMYSVTDQISASFKIVPVVSPESYEFIKKTFIAN
jgi:hypothetical protein